MTGLSDAIGRKINLDHFPTAEPAKVEWHAHWLSPPLVTALPPNTFLKVGSETDARIEAFGRLIGDAWREYSKIPLHVRRGNGIEWTAFAKLAHAASGVALPGGKPLARAPAMEVMKRNAAKADRLSAQAFKADHEAKIALVAHCRDAWRGLSGKEPPVKPSVLKPPLRGEADFVEFLEAVIKGAGKDWGAERALTAWRSVSKGDA